MTKTSRIMSNPVPRRCSPSPAAQTVEPNGIRGARNRIDDEYVLVSLPQSQSQLQSHLHRQPQPQPQPDATPIPLILPPFPAMNANGNTNTSTNTVTAPTYQPARTTSTTSTLPHPYNLPSIRPSSIPSPWPLLKTTTRRLLAAIGLALSLIMTWWTYASLQEARKANLLAFRAECRDLMQAGGVIEKGCAEALGREIVVRRDTEEKNEMEDRDNEKRSGIRKQGDATIMYGESDDPRWDFETLYAMLRAEWAAEALAYHDLSILSPPHTHTGKLIVEMLAETLDPRGLSASNPLAYSPKYYHKQDAPTSDRGHMVLDRGCFYLSLNGSCAFFGGEVVPICGRGEGELVCPAWRRMLRETEPWSPSTIDRVADGVDRMVFIILWLLPVWVVIRTAWKQIQEKEGLAREEREEKERTKKKKEEVKVEEKEKKE